MTDFVNLKVQKVTCPKCRHIDVYTVEQVKKFQDNDFEDYRCSLCYVPEGVTKVVKFYEQCSVCHQVYDSKKAECFCPPKESSIKFEVDPKNQWRGGRDKLAEQRKDEIEIQKAESKVKRKIIEAQNDKAEREIQNTKLLEKIVNLLENQKPTEKKFDAIQ